MEAQSSVLKKAAGAPRAQLHREHSCAESIAAPQFSSYSALLSQTPSFLQDEVHLSSGIGRRSDVAEGPAETSRRKMKAHAPAPPGKPAPLRVPADRTPPGDAALGCPQNLIHQQEALRNSTLDVTVVLPSGLEKQSVVSGSHAMMDLLVELCLQNHLNPSHHALEIRSSETQQPLSFKPNTLVGTLNVHTVFLKEKVPEEKAKPGPRKVPEHGRAFRMHHVHCCRKGIGVEQSCPLGLSIEGSGPQLHACSTAATGYGPRQPWKCGWNEEQKSVRLVVNYLRTQKAVVRVSPDAPLRSILPLICAKCHRRLVRVSPDAPLRSILPLICAKCDVRPEHVVLLRDSAAGEELELSKSLSELGVKELYAWDNRRVLTKTQSEPSLSCRGDLGPGTGTVLLKRETQAWVRCSLPSQALGLQGVLSHATHVSTRRDTPTPRTHTSSEATVPLDAQASAVAQLWRHPPHCPLCHSLQRVLCDSLHMCTCDCTVADGPGLEVVWQTFRKSSLGNDETDNEKKKFLGFFKVNKRSNSKGCLTMPNSPSAHARSLSLGPALSLGNISGVSMKSEMKKRRAPPPPGSGPLVQDKTPEKVSLGSQVDLQKKKRRAPAPPPPQPPPPSPLVPNRREDKEENRKSTMGVSHECDCRLQAVWVTLDLTVDKITSGVGADVDLLPSVGRQAPQKPPRGSTRGPPQLVPPPLPPPGPDEVEPLGPPGEGAGSEPSELRPELSLPPESRSHSGVDGILPVPSEAEETASVGSCFASEDTTEDSGVISSPSDIISLDSQHDSLKSKDKWATDQEDCSDQDLAGTPEPGHQKSPSWEGSGPAKLCLRAQAQQGSGAVRGHTRCGSCRPDRAQAALRAPGWLLQTQAQEGLCPWERDWVAASGQLTRAKSEEAAGTTDEDNLLVTGRLHSTLAEPDGGLDAQKPVRKDTCLHSALMDAIHAAGGKDKLRKTAEPPEERGPRTLSYTEADSERSALLAAIRGHSGTRSLRKPTDAVTLGSRAGTGLPQVSSSASAELWGCWAAVPPEAPGPLPMPQAPPAPMTAPRTSSGPLGDAVDARQALLDAIRSGSGAARLKKPEVTIAQVRPGHCAPPCPSAQAGPGQQGPAQRGQQSRRQWAPGISVALCPVLLAVFRAVLPFL
ncbi:Protein cordon-bleu [Heterocephalus glaber]|uniref:Protein cordon-bleu n=1 Tax=Heterocephalus glaber TaxID=10181 RepID=G5B3T6_HETGA|nr:Protein cordon-bleu [Heterocephalus glaber]